MSFTDYFIIVLNALLILVHLFRIIYILFKPKQLQHKIFHFPNGKYDILGYYLCAITLMMIVILMRLDVV
jgi:hypothetical protein